MLSQLASVVICKGSGEVGLKRTKEEFGGLAAPPPSLLCVMT